MTENWLAFNPQLGLMMWHFSGLISALKSRLEEIQEVSYRQSDKIIALRSVAKALESENELLSKDKGRQTRGKDENGGIQVCQ